MVLPGWTQLAPGGVIQDAGNSAEYHTGTWRSQRPVVEMERCTHCMYCWLFCPESSIVIQDDKFLGFDLEHCKGCGICATECPPKAIEMVLEVQGLGDDRP